MKALIALALLLAAAPAAHCQKALPPIPDSVSTQIGWVKVVRVPSPCNSEYAMGCFATAQRIIFVKDSTLSRIMEWRVVLHEIGHLRIRDDYIRIEEPGLEDRIVDLWARIKLEEMLADLARKP